MAQTGYTPIKLYYSTTPTQQPAGADLAYGELAINIYDGKLYFKNSSNVVTLLASTSDLGGVSTFSGGTTGLSPSSPTTGTITLSGTLNIANGGTGQTTAGAAFNALSPITATGDLIIGNGTNSATRLAIGTNGYVLTSNGTTASWQASTGGVTSFSGGTTGLLPSSSTTGAITLSGTLVAGNGGTGLTSPGTAGNVLTSNGSGWVSSAPAASGVSQAQAIAYSMTLGF